MVILLAATMNSCKQNKDDFGPYFPNQGIEIYDEKTEGDSLKTSPILPTEVSAQAQTQSSLVLDDSVLDSINRVPLLMISTEDSLMVTCICELPGQ